MHGGRGIMHRGRSTGNWTGGEENEIWHGFQPILR